MTLNCTLYIRFFYITLAFLFTTNMAFAKTDKYRCIWRDNPATTMTIAWNQVSGANPILYYDTKDNGTNISSYNTQQKPSRSIYAKGLNNKFVRLTNLKPNTKYYFIIKDSNSKSQRFWFQTAPDNNDEQLSILAGGDSRNYREGRQNANLLVAKLRPHCVVFGGDMTALDSDTEWSHWLDDWQLTTAPDGRMTPIIPARGNHERSNQSIVDLFDVPNPEVYYALNFGKDLLRVYTLNTMISTSGNQKTWLQNDLKKNQHIQWKMAQYHHPMRPHTARKPEGTSVYKSWAQLFYDNNVQLVVECDAHVCKTTYPIRPSYADGHDEGFVRDSKGTVYVGEGCWGAPIRPANDSKSWTRAAGSFNQIKWIWVSNDKIEIRTVKTDNANTVDFLSDATRFKMPSNINIWTPKTGAVVVIKSRNGTLAENKSSATLTPIQQSKPIPIPKPRLIDGLVIKNITITQEANNAVIKWQTQGEPKGALCDVQRSVDAVNFNSVAQIYLVGNTKSEQSYTIEDKGFDNQIVPYVYYRIRGTLPNGEEKFTTPIKIKAKDASQLPLLPLKNEGVVVNYELPEDGDVLFQLINDDGQIFKHLTYLKQEKGTQKKFIDLYGVKKGQYILVIKLTDGRMIYYQVII